MVDTMAAVIQLSEYRAHRLLPEHHPLMEEGRAIITDAMTQMIMEDFSGLPIAVRAMAINAVIKAMKDDSGCFATSFEAAVNVLRPAMNDAKRPFLWEFGLLKSSRLRIVELTLRKRCTVGEYEAALGKARRVIHGGGCISVALYQALGEGGIGGAV
jgi:hypothetical protein